MYDVGNKVNQYYLIFNKSRTNLGNEAAMLDYLTSCWHLSHRCVFENGGLQFINEWHNRIFDYYSIEIKDCYYTIVNGFDKVIDISCYENSTLAAAQRNLGKDESSYYTENHNKYGIYRKTPVPYTRKSSRGGPSQKVRKTARLFRMYADPEQKQFNRGSSHGIPSYWDDFPWRKPQKSWKSQRKSRHQYKEKKGD